jgi:peptide/nickel transport system substrate-binding protein
MKHLNRAALTAAVGILVALLAMGTAVAQSASSSSTTSTSSASGDKVVFNYGYDSDITSLNPYKLCCGEDYIYMELVYDIAFDYGDQLEAAPAIVTSWTPNSDSTEWTLKIRNDATFSDGSPVTVDDVVFSFQVAAIMPLYKNYLPFNPTFTKVDDSTILWKADEPTYAPIVPAFLPIVPESIWGQFVHPGDEDATKKDVKDFPNDNPIGSGPFTLTQYDKGQLLQFDVRPGYWGGDPKQVQQVNIRVYSNQEAMVEALKAGEVDFAYGIKSTLWNSPAIQNDPNITPDKADGGCWGNLAWNFGGQGGPDVTADPIIHDTKFRQAMSMAINRQEIVTKVYNDTSTTGYSMLMPGKNGSWYQDIPQDSRFDYNPDTAKQYLDSIGVVDSNGDGLREDPDTKQNLDLNIMTVSDVTGSSDTGKLISGYFSAVGVGSHLNDVDTNKAYDLWYSGDWDAYVWDWCPDPDPDFMLSVFTTDQCLGWSDGCWSDPAYDKMYTLQQTQTDFNDRHQTVDEMQQTIAKEIPTMVLNYWAELDAYRNDRFTGYIRNPLTVPQGNLPGTLVFGYDNNVSLDNLELVSGASSTTTSGLPAWVWIVGIAVIAVLVGAFVFARRKKEDEEVA